MTDLEQGRREQSTNVRRRPDGPPPGVLGAIVLALIIAAVIAHGVGSAYWQGIFAFGASVPLGIYAATVYARQLRLGIRVPGPGISFFGGITASVQLALSGLLAWAQTQVSALPAPVHNLVSKLVFVLGGAGATAGLGLLIAGIAVPAVIVRLVPRGLGWAGLVLGALGEITFLVLLWDGLDVLLPIAGFGGLIWLALVGFLLPRNRHDAEARTRQPGP